MCCCIKDNVVYKILDERKAYKLLSDIDSIVKDIEPVLSEISKWFDNYTLHDINHSLRVLDYMCDIAGEETLIKLSDLELAMIVYVALLHDIGMWISEDEIKGIQADSQFKYLLKKNDGKKKYAIQEYIRPIHGKRAYNYIVNKETYKSKFRDDSLTFVSYAEDIALICQSHMESITWINRNLKERFSKGKNYNSQYIAILLRVADYMDFDSRRAPEYLYNQKNLTGRSINEWKKHATIGNKEKINKEKNTIFFDITCDDFNLYCDLEDTMKAIGEEVKKSVIRTKQFEDEKYHLKIHDEIDINIDAKGFEPKRFSLNLDYHEVTNLLMGENLYGDKEYGLREILQNSIDACKVMQAYYSKNDPTAHYSPQISIIYDYDQNVVIVKDNGTGMSSNIINNYFLTIGKSYYRSDEYGKLGYEIDTISTFGIGFLSCFMLSKKVSVATKYYEDGEITTFSIEKNSKYICYEQQPFIDAHGTAISFDMEEFKSVFKTQEQLINFIDNNFYCLDLEIKIYDIHVNKYRLVGQAEANNITSGTPIDISSYFEGIICKVNISTVIDEFKIYSDFYQVKEPLSVVVLFTKKGIELIDSKDIENYRNNICSLAYSDTAFTDLILETFLYNKDDDFYYDNISDIEEVIEDYERFGFKVFENGFNRYSDDIDEKEDKWIDSIDRKQDTICIIWDKSISWEQTYEIMQQAKVRYLEDINAVSWNYDFNSSNNIDNMYSLTTSRLFEWNGDIYPNNPLHLISYQISVCHKGVYLNNVTIELPYIANVFSDIKIAVNITADDFNPSITRTDLTENQKIELAYSLGKGIHLFLMDKFNDDKPLSAALKRLLTSKYPRECIFCKPRNDI